MIKAIQIALSGLNAASTRVNTAASNIANMTSGGAIKGGTGPAPYAAQTVQQEANADGGTSATAIPKNPPFVPSYAPDSPFANSEGVIGAPNVDLAEEAVNLTLAETTYKANIKTIQTASDMMDELLDAFDKRV